MCTLQPDHTVLYRSAQKEMRRWWARHGWPWLVLIAAANLIYSAPFLTNNGMPFPGVSSPLQMALGDIAAWLVLVVMPWALPAVLWFAAARASTLAVLTPIREAAAPTPPGLQALLFWLACRQGLLPMSVTVLGAIIYCFMAYISQARIMSDLSWPLVPVSSGCIEAIAFVIGYMLWVLAFCTAFDRWRFGLLLICGPVALGLLFKVALPFEPLRDVMGNEHYDSGYATWQPDSAIPVYAVGVVIAAALLAALRLRHRKIGIWASAAMATIYALQFGSAFQVLPVSLGRSSLFFSRLFSAAGLQDGYRASWALYMPGYVTGMTGMMDSGAFMYAVSKKIELQTGGTILLTVLVANLLWLAVQHRILIWALRTSEGPH